MPVGAVGYGSQRTFQFVEVACPEFDEGVVNDFSDCFEVVLAGHDEIQSCVATQYS
jgi:hypothetical protein